MTPEQIEELKACIANTKQAVAEVEAMLADYAACGSEISKKYLAAAIKKHAAGVAANMRIPND